MISVVMACMAPSPSRLAVGELTTRRGLRQVAFGVASGLGGGLAFGFVGGFVFGPAAGIALGFAVWLGGGFAVGLAFGLEDSSPQAVGPRDVIRADGRYGLAGALAVGLAVGLALGLAFGIAFGFAVGLAWMADVWTRYHVTVLIAAIRGSAPMRYGAFLDWAVQAGLLRVSGVAYQFRHRQIQDWLASHSSQEFHDGVVLSVPVTARTDPHHHESTLPEHEHDQQPGAPALITVEAPDLLLHWGGRGDLNPRHPGPQPGALPTELRPPSPHGPEGGIRSIPGITHRAELDSRSSPGSSALAGTEAPTVSRPAISRAVAVSGPGGGTNTASR